MRTLKFIVDGETIKPDPKCSFNGLFPGANPEIEANFTFSEDWKSRVKVVAFWSILGKEYPPQTLNDEGTCRIPAEALERPSFRMQLFGLYRGAMTSTNQLTIYQRGGKA